MQKLEDFIKRRTEAVLTIAGNQQMYLRQKFDVNAQYYTKKQLNKCQIRKKYTKIVQIISC